MQRTNSGQARKECVEKGSHGQGWQCGRGVGTRDRDSNRKREVWVDRGRVERNAPPAKKVGGMWGRACRVRRICSVL